MVVSPRERTFALTVEAVVLVVATPQGGSTKEKPIYNFWGKTKRSIHSKLGLNGRANQKVSWIYSGI